MSTLLPGYCVGVPQLPQCALAPPARTCSEAPFLWVPPHTRPLLDSRCRYCHPQGKCVHPSLQRSHCSCSKSCPAPGAGGELIIFSRRKLTGAVSSPPSLDPPLLPLGPCSTSPAPIAASMFLYSIYLVSVKHGDFLSSRYSCLLHLHTRKRKGNRKGKDILVTIFKKLKKNFHLVFL